MPTYDYECKSCGHAFELFQQMSDSVKRKCPECGKLKLHRHVGTGAGVLFKGSGFYETDYRSASYKKAAEADKKAASGGDGKKKSDTKSADSSSAKTGSKKKAKKSE
jgi:putative FmdB family regulatory protein